MEPTPPSSRVFQAIDKSTFGKATQTVFKIPKSEVAKQELLSRFTAGQQTEPFVKGLLRTAAGAGILVLGVAAGVALAPITVPLGIIGITLGYLGGKIVGLVKPEMKAHHYGLMGGLAIGTLGTAALALLGIRLMTKPVTRERQTQTIPDETHKEAKENLEHDTKIAVDSLKSFFGQNIDDVTKQAQAELEKYPDYKKQLQEVTEKLKEIESRLETVASRGEELKNQEKAIHTRNENQPKMDVIDEMRLMSLKPVIEDQEQIQTLQSELQRISSVSQKEDQTFLDIVRTPTDFVFKQQKGLQKNLTDLDQILKGKLTEENINESIKIINRLPFDPRNDSISKDRMSLINLITGGKERVLKRDELVKVYHIINNNLRHIK